MADTNSTADALKQKYASVFQLLDQLKVHLHRVQLQDGKLYVQGTAESEQAKNKVLDAIKAVDPGWERDLTCEIRTEAGQSPDNSGQTTVNTSQDFSTRD